MHVPYNLANNTNKEQQSVAPGFLWKSLVQNTKGGNEQVTYYKVTKKRGMPIRLGGFKSTNFNHKWQNPKPLNV